MSNLPYAEQAESAVLGSVIYSNENWEVIKSKLSVDDFCSPRNQIIYQCYKALRDSGKPVDEVTLGEYLGSIGKMKNVGAEYIFEMTQNCPVVTNVGHYIDAVKGASVKRNTLNMMSNYYKTAQNMSYNELGPLMSEFVSNLETSTNYNDGAPKFTKMSNIISDYFTEAAEGEGYVTVKSGYYELDHLTDGLVYGVLDVLAARPRMGKTAFGLNLLKQYGIDRKVPSAFFSIEMPKRQIAERLLSIVSGVQSRQIKDVLTDKLQDESVYEKLTEATDRLSNAPIFYDQDSRRTNEIICAIKDLHRLHGVKFVVIDYLQIIKTERRKNDTRDAELAYVCREFQEAAKALDINILLLCQINREAEKNSDKRPRLDQLRESGSIENEAARVMLLYRDDVYESNSKQKGMCEVIVAKNRFGQTGKALLKFNETCTRFENNPHPGF